MKQRSAVGLRVGAWAITCCLACGGGREDAPAVTKTAPTPVANEGAVSGEDVEALTEPEEQPPRKPPPSPFLVKELGPADGAALSDLAWSADASRLASVDADGTVRVWDTQNWEQVREVPGSPGEDHRVALSGDAARIVTNHGAQVRVLDGQSGEELLSLAHEGATRAVAIDAEAKLIASGGVDGLRIWTGKGKARHHIEAQLAVIDLRLSPDAKQLASTWSDGTVRVINPSKGRVIAKIVPTAGRPLGGLALSGDGSKLIVDTGELPSLMFETKGGEASRRLFYADPLGLDGGGNLLLASSELDGGYPLVQLVDVNAGEAVRDYAGHDGEIVAGGFSPNGLIFATAGTDAKLIVWAAP